MSGISDSSEKKSGKVINLFESLDGAEYIELKRPQILERLVEVGLSLSDENSYENLLQKMTDYGLEIGNCEGISIYRVKKKYIMFMTSRNKLLEKREKNKSSSFVGNMIPIDSETISGYCASTGKIIKIDDVYKLPEDSPYKFNPSYDNMVNYRSRSMVVIPMLDTKGNVLGVMQFINFLDRGQVRSFPDELVHYLKALAN